ncbi:hypothetical protein JJJ17_11155 [Paracoccus caeni]|uniref:Uncharacterized protein n=1 Tax=Paracoccus caeni TaxID=657651 RepID=A0A934SJY7_9RHOB|nr:hypothetical protein [Paracoccus caeni]MBK4216484.1 hypothetical protein [Paracoccus caeni]
MTRTRHEFHPVVPGAFNGGLSRTEFYDGMVLGEADMKREQSYWQMKRRLTNRALGQGVVWGLSLHWDAKARSFTLCPGYGLSCCGDDLVVECTETVAERDLIDPCSQDFRDILKAAQGPCTDPCDTRPDAPVEAVLMLEYVECPGLPRQAFEDPCATKATGCKYSAVRETTRLRLVPPPPPPAPKPMERFCQQIAELRAMLAAEGLPPPPAPAPAPAADAAAIGAPPVAVMLSLENGSQTLKGATREELASRAGAQGTLSLAVSDSQPLVFSLTPPLGYGFLRTWEKTAQGQETSQQTIETLMELSFRESDLKAGGHMERYPLVEIAPLAGGQSYEIAYAVEARRTASAVEAVIRVVSVRRLHKVKDCGSLLRVWADRADPLCATRTLLLAAVWGWFKGLVGPAPCALPNADGTAEPDPTRAAIGWMAGWLAWRILFRIDIAESTLAASAQRCLHKLFQAWCAEFNYKGPRCDCHQHGIMLGSVLISPKGKIICFDEWKHRRYVLTGPLLTHWAGLFGLPSIDAVATRLASWICCVARAPLIPIDAAAAAAIRAQLLSADGDLRLGGRRRLNIQRLLDEGLPFGGVGVGGGGEGGAVAQPAPPAAVTKQIADANFRVLEARTDTAPVMARGPARELIREIAPAVALAELKPLGEEGAFDAVIAAMEADGVNNVDQLFALDPDLAAKKLRAGLVGSPGLEDAAAADRAVGQVFTAAQRSLEAIGTAVVAEAERRPDEELFTRSDLRQTATLGAIRKAVNVHLKGTGLSAAAVRGIATRVADRG